MSDSLPKPPRCLLQIYAKYPQPGQVKTRLGRKLGAVLATRLYCHMLESTLSMATSLLPPDFAVELWGDSDAERPAFRCLLQRHAVLHYHRQVQGSLGERLCWGMQQGLQRAEHVLQIGTDCSVLQRGHIVAAHRALRAGSDVSLIPALDGGYVLIGFSRALPSVFDKIDWGTSRVLSQTRMAIADIGARVHLQPALWDVDTVEDLRHDRRHSALQA